jgi:hypothetical protein
MDIIKNFTICKHCNKELDNPVSLPCNRTICQKHVSELAGQNADLDCPCCEETHTIPLDGYQVNEMIKQLLKSDVHNLVQN